MTTPADPPEAGTVGPPRRRWNRRRLDDLGLAYFLFLWERPRYILGTCLVAGAAAGLAELIGDWQDFGPTSTWDMVRFPLILLVGMIYEALWVFPHYGRWMQARRPGWRYPGWAESDGHLPDGPAPEVVRSDVRSATRPGRRASRRRRG